MSTAALSPAAMRIVTWLGEVGPRWGLPGSACRVHAALYLAAKPMPAGVFPELLGLDARETEEALAWLEAHGLIEASPAGWRTGVDPWALMMQTLEARRTQELGQARMVIDQWRREGQREDPLVSRQADRLFDLVEDIAAIDAGTRGLSASTTRLLIGLGGRAARLFGNGIGARGRR
jgi:DNA-binding transcriptional regulator GbsR (MarR family)